MTCRRGSEATREWPAWEWDFTWRSQSVKTSISSDPASAADYAVLATSTPARLKIKNVKCFVHSLWFVFVCEGKWLLCRARWCHSKSSVRLSARPSVTVCDVQVRFSHRWEYFEKNFTADIAYGTCSDWPQHAWSIWSTENTSKIRVDGWGHEHKNLQYLWNVPDRTKVIMMD